MKYNFMNGVQRASKRHKGMTLAAIIGATLTFAMPIASFAQGGNGGGGTGGGNTTTTTTTCQPLQSFKVVPGYAPGGGNSAAVWVSYSMKNCDPSITQAFVADFYNLDNGDVFEAQLQGVTNSITLDYDSAHFSTNYRVDVRVIDRYTNNVLASGTTTTATPATKNAAGVVSL